MSDRNERMLVLKEQGFDLADIAQRFSITVHTVKSAISRARIRRRQVIEAMETPAR